VSVLSPAPAPTRRATAQPALMGECSLNPPPVPVEYQLTQLSDEQHCKSVVNTFDSPWPVDGSQSRGGYATYWRGMGRWVVNIPDAIPSDLAAPMLCGGVTAFSPLTQHGAGPGKRIGIVGIGGLGHFGVMGAKALGCSEIVAISRTSTKKADAMKMGATGFIATDEDKDWATTHAGTLDLIVSTVSSPKMPLASYLNLLAYKGKFVQVGAPEDEVAGFNCFALIGKRASIWGSETGSAPEIQKMLDFFAEKGVKTWNVNRPMKEANDVIVDMDAGKARYRYVLCNGST